MRIGIDSVAQNVKLKKLDVFLPGDKLFAKLFRIKLFRTYQVFYWRFSSELKINLKDKNSIIIKKISPKIFIIR